MTNHTVSLNAPFGKASPRLIKQDLLNCLPLESAAFCARAHYMTLKLDAPPEYIIGSLLAAHSLLLASRGYNIDPLWVWLLGNVKIGKRAVVRLTCDFLLDTWNRQEATFLEDRPPLIQIDDSTVQGIQGALPRYYDEKRGTSVAMLQGSIIAQLLGNNSFQAGLNNLIAGESHFPERRELQRRSGGRSSLAETAIIKPRIGALLHTTVEDAVTNITQAATMSGFLNRNLIIHAVVDPEYLGAYRADCSAENEYAFDCESALYCNQDVAIPHGQITLSDDVGAYWDALKKQAYLSYKKDGEDVEVTPTAKESALLVSTLEQATNISKLFSALLCQPIVSLPIFQRAYAYAELGAAGVSKLESWIGADEIAKHADVVETWLTQAGARGITRSNLSRRLKLDTGKLDQVISVLQKDRRVLLPAPVETKYGEEICYYETCSAPDIAHFDRQQKERRKWN